MTEFDILTIPYTINDLITELKLAAANSYNIDNIWEFVTLRVSQFVPDYTTKMITISDISATGIFSLLRINNGYLPIGYENKNRVDILGEILCDKYLSEFELLVLLGYKPTNVIIEDHKYVNRISKENPYSENFTINDICVSMNIMADTAKKLGTSDMPTIIKHITGTEIVNKYTLEQSKLHPYFLFMTGFVPNGYNNTTDAIVEINHLRETYI